MNVEFSDFTISRKTLLFADLMESTRLLDQHEKEVVPRWRALVNHVINEVLPQNGGRFVNSLGDGFLLAFDTEKEAIAAGFLIQEKCKNDNQSQPEFLRLHLRMGLEVGEFTIDKQDVYGRAAMMGARLMTLAGPGEIVISADLMDLLVNNVDADIEDLGDCYIKHLDKPVRAYRIGPPGPDVSNFEILDPTQMLPTIAVLPLHARDGRANNIVGRIISEEVIGKLTVSSYINVISSLTSASLATRNLDIQEIGQKLNATYVLSGSFHDSGDRLTINLELSETKDQSIVWTSRYEASLNSLLHSESETITEIAHSVCKHLLLRELREVENKSWLTLESYKLLLAAISRMHRLSANRFKEALELLEVVAGRATRQYLPYAWMGKWYVLKTQQGWTDNPQRDGELALNCTKKALDYNPNSSLALTIDGFVHTNLLRELDKASTRYEQAVSANPNDSLAHLAKGMLHAFRGEGEQAVANTTLARKLSPFDPMGYFYDSLSGSAKLAAGEAEDALFLAERSLKANRTHTSTLRVKAIALWKLDRHEEARKTVADLLALEPEFTVSKFLAKSPSAEFECGRDWAEVLRKAGAPE